MTIYDIGFIFVTILVLIYIVWIDYSKEQDILRLTNEIRNLQRDVSIYSDIISALQDEALSVRERLTLHSDWLDNHSEWLRLHDTALGATKEKDNESR